MNRREFLVGAGALGTFAATRLYGEEVAGEKPILRFGLVTDLHYADLPPDARVSEVVGRRFYRESKRKLEEAVAVFNRRGVDFAVELGDFKDLTGGKAETLAYLDEIEATFAKFNGPRYHVFGNHDFDCLTKEDLARHLSNDGKPMTSGYYSFVRAGVTFIVLDCCYDSNLKHYGCNNPWSDANVPPEELAWLAGELKKAPGQVVILTHQRLDPAAIHLHRVKNAEAIRDLLEKSGKVKLVCTGHQHLGGITEHRDIRYYSLIAMVCDSGPRANSFAEVALFSDGAFTVTGYRNATSYGEPKGEI